MTPLDRAHAAMQDAPDDDAARLTFYERLADAELHVLLRTEAEGDTIDPRLFQTSQGTFVLVFDRAERLAEFAKGHAPFAALSGRVLSAMLAGRRIGMALNPDVAPSSHLVPSDAVDWLSGALRGAPDEVEARPTELHPPGDLPDRLLTALDTKLAIAAGRARMAYLSQATYDTGATGHLLAFIDPAEGAEHALARAVREAVVFSGIEAGALDVAFFPAADPVAARLARIGLRVDLPKSDPSPPGAPGNDPEKPPKLR